MSMIGNYTAVTSEQLDAFIDNPSLVPKYLYPDLSAPNSTWVGKIRNLFRPERHSHGDEPVGDAETTSIDIDKAWHGIHYTLTGQPEGGNVPLVNTVLGGTEIGEDVGYGPARYLTPQQVAAVSEALEQVTPEVFSSRIDYAGLAAAEIYPDIWDEGNDAGEYLAEYYKQLRSFFKQLHQDGNAVLCYIN